MNVKLSDLQIKIMKWLQENQADIQKSGLLSYQGGLLNIEDSYKRLKFDVAKEVGKVVKGRRGRERVKTSFHPTFSNSFKPLVKKRLVTPDCQLTRKGIELVAKLS